MKTCSTCKIEKDESEFYKDKNKTDGLRCNCKSCTKQNRKQYNLSHKDSRLEYNKRYYQEHKDEILSNKVLYQKKNKDKKAQYNKQWYQKHKKSHNQQQKEYHKKRKQIDPLYRFMREIRSVINNAFERGGWTKDSTTQELLCCSFQDLIKYMGPKPDGHVEKDHICPCAQAQNKEELIKLQHYTNFRWMMALDNNKKKHYKTPEAEEMCRKLLNREWID